MAWQFEMDHVPIAWQNLSSVSTAFAEIGLTPEYGGKHQNGITHMALLGFPDGSYLELIAERSDATSQAHAFWPEYIRSNAGPCAWFARSSNLRADCHRLLDAGVPIDGPRYGSRSQENGKLIEWDWARFGTSDTRQLLPSLIADRTPRSYRVSTSPSVRNSSLVGIDQIVLAVANLSERIDYFTDVFGFPTPVQELVPGFGTVAAFPGQPVALASPTDTSSDTDWLVDRLEQYPDSPCAVLLATSDLTAARQELLLTEPGKWANGTVAFADSSILSRHVGVIER